LQVEAFYTRDSQQTFVISERLQVLLPLALVIISFAFSWRILSTFVVFVLRAVTVFIVIIFIFIVIVRVLIRSFQDTFNQFGSDLALAEVISVSIYDKSTRNLITCQ
jgi:hypothetical protein